MALGSRCRATCAPIANHPTMCLSRHSCCCDVASRHRQPRARCPQMEEALVSIVVFQAQPALAHALLLYIKALPSGKASTQLKEPSHPFLRPEEFKIAISPLAFVDAVSPRLQVLGSGAATAGADHRARFRHPARSRAGPRAHRHTPRTADIAATLPGRPKVNTVVVDMLLTKVAPKRSRSTDPDWTPASDGGVLAYV